MTPTQRAAMEQALEALEGLQHAACELSDKKLERFINACGALRAALAEQPAEQEPFQPDWVNYRQGLRDGWTEGYEQGIADERASAANIGIAGFDAKVHPARVNPYESTAPNPTKSAEQEPVAPARHSEIALMEKAVKRVGMVSLLNHGAASCVYTEGCERVSQDHLLAYTREIALHCAAALLQTVAPDAPQQEGETQ